MVGIYKPSSRWTWSFLLIALVQAIVGLALEAYVFGKYQFAVDNEDRTGPEDNSGQTVTALKNAIPTYLSVFMFGFIYQLLLVYDALRLKNTIQVIGLCVYNMGILVYAAIQIDQLKDNVDRLSEKNILGLNFWSSVKASLIALPILMAVGTMFLVVVTWKLYDEFAWTIYKHISADLRLKRRYLTYQIYIALLKFDFFFFLGFTVQFLVIVTNTKDVEFWLTIAAIPVTIVLLMLAAYWTRKENTVGMIAIIIIYFAAMAYFLFKLIRMYSNDDRANDYLPARRMLSTFAGLTIVLLVGTIIIACMCTHNFNKGLKPHVDRRGGVGNADEVKYQTEMPAYGGSPAAQPMPSRMTID
ncbi:hypothetical protein EJ05DRAFT_360184 [Pseudovirgaria hyperparasitica]|uniref:Uncharacterized protein n=1 Tax=Pseudovirgaria hyperparasitica TaxID=470096 RepID=A0A6A6W6X7_9PEZI|nr:uncharacterized protein EJ05DRAFT_360184 [Pseudovirgaria hyperparasitica]KAF2758638.1 hypothetical protein EJ05DRAFT_360184 [Pseudovirgaria hyperparasitica]